MLRRLFLFSLLTCAVGAFSSAEVVWFSNTSCGSQRHLCVPSFLLRSKTADLEDLPPAAPPAAGLADLPCVLSLNTDIVDLLYLLFLLCPNRPRGPGGCPPALPRLVAAWRSSWLRAPRRPLVPRCSALLPPSLSAQPLDLSPLPRPQETRVAPPLARELFTAHQPIFFFSFLSSRFWSEKSVGKLSCGAEEDRSPKGDKSYKVVMMIYRRRRQKKTNVGFLPPVAHKSKLRTDG